MVKGPQTQVASRLATIAGCLLLASPFIVRAGAADPMNDTPMPPYARSSVGNSLPSYEAMWALFVHITAREEQQKGSGIAMLKATIGLREDGATSLFQYVQKSISTHQALSAELTKEICSKRERFTSRASLATALRDMDRQLDRAREMDVSNLPNLLDASETQVLTEWVEANLKPSLRSIEIDHALFFETHQSDPSQILDQLCGGNLVG